MFISIRSKLLTACIAIPGCALVESATLKFFAVDTYNSDLIKKNLIACSGELVVKFAASQLPPL